MAIDDRPTIAAPDDDPYLWLEEIEGERALDFVDRQSRLTLETFGGRQFVIDRDTLAAIYDRADNIPYVTRSSGLVYNLWKDAKNPRGLWRRTTLRLSQRRAELGDAAGHRSPRHRRGRGLAAQLDPTAAGKPTRDRRPLPGRQRRGHAAGIRYWIPRHSSQADLPCRKPRAVSNGSTLTHSCFRALLARAWRRHQAMREPFGCGAAASPWNGRRCCFEVPADQMAAYCSVDDTGPNAADVVHRSD